MIFKYLKYLKNKPSEPKKFLFIFYSVGIIGFALPFSQEFFSFLIPYSIFLSFALLMLIHSIWNVRQIILFSSIVISTFFIEAIGVNTGKIFGVYQYGNIMGVKSFNTPLIIGFNWLMLLYCCFLLLEKTKWHWLLKWLLAALVMVLYDVLLEPVAIGLNMWNWHLGTPPWQNYFAWFMVSLLALLPFYFLRLRFTNPLAVSLLLIQFVFFALLNIIVKY